MPKLSWSIEKKKVKDLKEYEGNPRTISKEDFEELKKSIDDDGFHKVLTLDTENIILSGNQSRKALLELGVEEVNCAVPNQKLTEKQRRKIVLNSNRHNGMWDFGELSLNWSKEELMLGGFKDFELGFLGEGEKMVDHDKLTKSLDTYLEGNIKQLVFFFASKDYQGIVDRLAALMVSMGVEDNTSVFVKLLDYYEAHNEIKTIEENEEIDTTEEGN